MIHPSENDDDDDDISEVFDIVQSSQVNFDEENLTDLEHDALVNCEPMIEQNLERSSQRRLNIIGGPNSAFARLFPDKYRQEQQYSKSIDDDDGADIRDYYRRQMRKTRRVRFYTDENRQLSSRAQSEPTINHDPNPEIIYKQNPEKLIYTQNVAIRYLKPPTPPPPGPIVIREVRSTPPEEPPPLIVSSTPPIPPLTPSPVIVREEPPLPPAHLPTKIITKTLPPPPSAPRRVIIKRHTPLPAKPRPLIIEKWLPYKSAGERPILYERAKPIEQQYRSHQRNLIVQYEPARIQIEPKLESFGCFRADPNQYRAQHGSSLRRTDSIRRVLKDLGCDPDLITSTNYQTCQQQSKNTSSSHYDYPRQSTTCFTDEQLDTLIGTTISNSNKQESHYDIPRCDRYLVTMV